MRIDHLTNIDLISLQTQQTQLLPQSVQRRQTAAALDSYTRSTKSATIIDAEYVEISSTSKIALPSKPSSILIDFDTNEVNDFSCGQQQRISKNNPMSRYQEMAAKLPISGKYVNIFT